MEIKVIGPEGKEVVPETPKEMTEPVETPVVTGDLLFQQVGQMFDFKPSEIGQYHDKLDTLINYAKTQTDDHSPEGLKWAIRSLENKVGTPPLGEKMVNYLSTYAYIKLESLKFAEMAKTYERNP